MKKQFAVFGLGSFGRSVALTLENLGCDVVVVDKSYEKIQEISDMVSYAMRADVSDPDALHALGGRNLDGAVVAVSESLEASIMATIISKEMGIPYVLAKAKDELQGAILEKVGADAIAYPECDMGERVAKSLMSTAFADWWQQCCLFDFLIGNPRNCRQKCLTDLCICHQLFETKIIFRSHQKLRCILFFHSHSSCFPNEFTGKQDFS